MNPKGRLVVIGTPIGNLGDITDRARDTLGAVDLIACEDTRRTGRLLQLLGLDKKPLLVVNEHTEHQAASEVVRRISEGASVALVSDAGMPGISDPGQRTIRTVLDADQAVEILPGPTALITALVASGLATGRFVFEGFLARKGRERSEQLDQIAVERRTVVFYESPKRVAATLQDLARVCGEDREVAVARELTKLHEEVVRGTLSEVIGVLGDASPRGEFVVVLAGAGDTAVTWTDDDLRTRLDRHRADGASTRDAVLAVVEESGVEKRRVYALATRGP